MGNRQQSRFIALVSNGERLHELMNVADESENAGTLQYLKTLDSITSKQQQLSNATKQFYTSLGGENIWKGVLTILTKVVNNLNKSYKLFGSFPVTAISVIADVVSIAKNLLLRLLTWLAKQWTQAFNPEAAEKSYDILANSMTARLTRAFRKIAAERKAALTPTEEEKQAVQGGEKKQATESKPSENVEKTEEKKETEKEQAKVEKSNEQIQKAEEKKAEKAQEDSRAEIVTRSMNMAEHTAANIEPVSQDVVTTTVDKVGEAVTVAAQETAAAIVDSVEEVAVPQAQEGAKKASEEVKEKVKENIEKAREEIKENIKKVEKETKKSETTKTKRKTKAESTSKPKIKPVTKEERENSFKALTQKVEYGGLSQEGKRLYAYDYLFPDEQFPDDILFKKAEAKLNEGILPYSQEDLAGLKGLIESRPEEDKTKIKLSDLYPDLARLADNGNTAAADLMKDYFFENNYTKSEGLTFEKSIDDMKIKLQTLDKVKTLSASAESFAQTSKTITDTEEKLKRLEGYIGKLPSLEEQVTKINNQVIDNPVTGSKFSVVKGKTVGEIEKMYQGITPTKFDEWGLVTKRQGKKPILDKNGNRQYLSDKELEAVSESSGKSIKELKDIKTRDIISQQYEAIKPQLEERNNLLLNFAKENKEFSDGDRSKRRPKDLSEVSELQQKLNETLNNTKETLTQPFDELLSTLSPENLSGASPETLKSIYTSITGQMSVLKHTIGEDAYKAVEKIIEPILNNIEKVLTPDIATPDLSNPDTRTENYNAYLQQIDEAITNAISNRVKAKLEAAKEEIKKNLDSILFKELVAELGARENEARNTTTTKLDSPGLSADPQAYAYEQWLRRNANNPIDARKVQGTQENQLWRESEKQREREEKERERQQEIEQNRIIATYGAKMPLALSPVSSLAIKPESQMSVYNTQSTDSSDYENMTKEAVNAFADKGEEGIRETLTNMSNEAIDAFIRNLRITCSKLTNNFANSDDFRTKFLNDLVSTTSGIGIDIKKSRQNQNGASVSQGAPKRLEDSETKYGRELDQGYYGDLDSKPRTDSDTNQETAYQAALQKTIELLQEKKNIKLEDKELEQVKNTITTASTEAQLDQIIQVNNLTKEQKEQLEELIAKRREEIQLANQTGLQKAWGAVKNLWGTLGDSKVANTVNKIGTGFRTISYMIDQSDRKGKAFAGTMELVGGTMSGIAKIATKDYIGGAITLITSAISGIKKLAYPLDDQIADAEEKAEELSNEAIQAESDEKTLDEGIEKVKELEKTRYDSKESAEEYQEAVDSLADSYPQLIAGMDESGNIILDMTNAEAELAEARQKTADATFESAKSEYKEAALKLKKAQDDVSGIGVEVDSEKKSGMIYNAAYERIKDGLSLEENQFDYAINSAIDVVSNALVQNPHMKQEDIANIFLKNAMTNSTDRIQAELEELAIDKQGNIISDIAYDRNASPEVKAIIDGYNSLKGQNTSEDTLDRLINDFDFSNTEDVSSWMTFKEQLSNIKKAYTDNNKDIPDILEDTMKIVDNYLEDNKELVAAQKVTSGAFTKVASAALYSEYGVEDTAANVLATAQMENYRKTANNGKYQTLDYDTLLEKDGTQAAFQGFADTAQDFYDSLNSVQQEIFTDAMSNMDDYTAEALMSELNVDPDSDVGIAITTAFAENLTAMQTRLAKRINNSDYIEDVFSIDDEGNYEAKQLTGAGTNWNYDKTSGVDNIALIVSDYNRRFSKLLTSHTEQIINESLDYVEGLEERGLGSKANEYGLKYAEFMSAVGNLDEETHEVTALLEQLDTDADLTSYSGIQEAIELIQGNEDLSQASKDALIGVLQQLQGTIISSVYVEAEALREEIKDFGENGAETISKISEGASLDDAYTAYETMIQSIETARDSWTGKGDNPYESTAGKSFNELFQMDPSEPGQYLISSAELIETYTNAELANLKERYDTLKDNADEAYRNLIDVDTKELSESFTVTTKSLAKGFNDWKSKNAEDVDDTIAEYFNSGEAETVDLLQWTEILGITNEYEQYLTQYAAETDKDKKEELTTGFLKTIEDAKKQSEDAIKALDTYYEVYSKTLLSSNLAAAGYVRKAIDQLYKQSNDPDVAIDTPSIKSILAGDYGDLDDDLKPYVLSYAEQVASDVSTLWDNFQSYGKDWVESNFSQYSNLKEYETEIFDILDSGTNEDVYKGLANYMQQSTEDYNSGLVKAIQKDEQKTRGAQESLAKAVQDEESGRLIFESLSDLQAFADDMGITLDEIGYEWIDEVNGYATDLDKADVFIEQVENGAAILEDSLLNLAGTVNDSISSAIEGTLAAVNKDTLVGNLAKMGLNLSDDNLTIDFTLTSKGYKLTKQSLADIYVNMKNINSLAADTMLDNLVKSAQDADKSLENIYVVLGRIEDIEKELATVGDNNKRRNELLTELDVAEQIRDTLMEAGDAFNFMDNDLPTGMTNPNSAWEGMGEAFEIFNGDDFKKGRIGFTDLYNMITMMDEAGATLVTSSTKFKKDANWAQELINAAAGCMKMIDGEAFVDLGDLGTQFGLGASALQEGTTDGIHLIAQSQIDMLDAAIRILDTIATVEDLDVEGDGIDMDNIFTFDGDTYQFTEGAETFLNKLQDVIGNVQIGGMDLKDALLKLTEEGEEGVQKVVTFISSLSTIDWTADPTSITNTIMDLLKGLFPNERITEGKSIFDILKVPDDANTDSEEFKAWLDEVGLTAEKYEKVKDLLTNNGRIAQSGTLYSSLKKMLGLEEGTSLSNAFDDFYAANSGKSTSEILQMWDNIDVKDDGNGKITGYTYTDTNGVEHELGTEPEEWGGKIEEIENENLRQYKITSNLGDNTAIGNEEVSSLTLSTGEEIDYVYAGEEGDWTFSYKGQSKTFNTWEEGQAWIRKMASKDKLKENGNIQYDDTSYNSGTLTLETGAKVKWRYSAETGEAVYVASDGTEWSTLDELKDREYEIYLTNYWVSNGTRNGAKTKEEYIEQKFGVKTTIEGEVNTNTTSAQKQDLANKVLGATDENGYVEVDEELSLAFSNVGITLPEGSKVTQNELLQLLGVETENKVLNITTNADEFSQKLISLLGEDGTGTIPVTLLISSTDGSEVEDGSTVTFTVQGIEEVETLLKVLNDTDLHIIKIQYQDANGNPITLGTPTGSLNTTLGLGASNPSLSGATLNVTGSTVEGDWTVPDMTLSGSNVNITGDATVNGSCNCSGGTTGNSGGTTSGAGDTSGSSGGSGKSGDSGNNNNENTGNTSAAINAFITNLNAAMPNAGLQAGASLGTAANIGANTAKDAIKKAFKDTMDGITDKTVKVNVKYPSPITIAVKVNASGNNVTSTNPVVSVSGNVPPTKTAAKGNVALSTGTLMGELGPELVVSNGHYFTVGENGPEFVDLASDAIVFNHLQTRQLLNNGSASTYGKPVTNERKATSFAKGNAMASASEAAAQLRTIRAQWQRLLDMSASDFGKKAGSGGGGGGGDEDEGAVISEYERWYNLLRQIDHYEKEISLEQAKRENMINGSDYSNSLQRELEILKKQKEAYSDLVDLQKDFYDKRRADLKASEYSKIFTYDENGLMQYVDGQGRGLDVLATLNATNVNGAAKMNASQQLAYLKSIGFNTSVLNKDASGKTMKSDSERIQVFWDSVDSWKEELDSLYDEYHDNANSLEETISSMNEIIQEYIDKQLDVEEKLKTAIEDREQAIIDKLEDQKEALENAASAYTEGLSSALDKEKSLYDNEESQAETQKLQRQLAILQRSGGSASEIKSLQDQLDSRLKDDYFNKMQEQIDAIQEASDKEIERLDKQIEIANTALDYQKENGLLWQEVYNMMDNWSTSDIVNFIAKYTSSYKENSALQNAEDTKETALNVAAYKSQKASAMFEEKYGEKTGKLNFDIDSYKDLYEEAKEAYTSAFAETNDPDQAEAAADAVIAKQTEDKNNKWDAFISRLGIDETDNKDVYNAGRASYLSSMDEQTAGQAMRDKATELAEKALGNKLLYNQYVYKSNSFGRKNKALNKAVAKGTAVDLKEIGLGGDGKTWVAKIGVNGTEGYVYADSLVENKDQWKKYTALLSGSLKGYATGGLNTSTGPAMLHGTSSKPEAILNATDTKFFREQLFGNGDYSLRKTIEAVQAMQSNLASASENNVDNSTYYNFNGIEIKIESGVISSDYDAQAAGDKIMEQLTALARKSQNVGVSRR